MRIIMRGEETNEQATTEDFIYEEVEAATKGFALEMLIGKGSHGSVYKGVTGDGRIVAVKKLSSHERSASNKMRLEKEIEMLESINSPQFVNIVGIGQAEGEKLILMEYMPNGSLHDLLHLSPKPPPWSRRLLIALQLARAMQVLHQAVPPIIHRDIKSSNVLFDSGWNAKLADFSLAVRQVGSHLSAPPAGTIGYIDPSYTGPTKLGTKNDIFSYGVVLLELVSGRQVMDATYEMTSIVAWAVPLLSSGLVAEVCDPRLLLSSTMKKIISQVLRMATRCISLEAEKRPSAREIVEDLQAIVKYLQLSIWGHLKSNLYRRLYPHFSSWIIKRRQRVTTRIICMDHLCEEDEANADGNVMLVNAVQIPIVESS